MNCCLLIAMGKHFVGNWKICFRKSSPYWPTIEQRFSSGANLYSDSPDMFKFNSISNIFEERERERDRERFWLLIESIWISGGLKNTTPLHHSQPSCNSILVCQLVTSHQYNTNNQGTATKTPKQR